MKRTVLDELYYWGRLQPDREIDFNGFFWAREGGGVLFDPMEMSEAEAGLFEAKGGAEHLVLTNHDHLRDTARLKERHGLTVYAPAGEEERFGDDAALVDVWYDSSDGLPSDLGIEAYELGGGKSEVEMALYLQPLQAVLFGDAVRSHESGRLRLLPEPKLEDRDRLIQDLRVLAGLPLDAILLGDGDSFFYRAEDAFRELLESL